MFPRALVALSLATTMLWVVAAPSQATPEFYVDLFRRGPSIGEHLVDSETSTPPTPANIYDDDFVSDGTNSFYLWEYESEAAPTAMKLFGSAATYSLYVVGAEWWEQTRWRWDDVVFSCDDGRAQVEAALRIQVKGYAAGFTQTLDTAPRGRVELYLGHPQYAWTQGIWRAGSNNGGGTVPEPPSTGVFAGSTGDDLDLTVPFQMGEPPSPFVPTGTPVVVSPTFTLAFDVRNETVVGAFRPSNGGGISIPTSGLVFNLPEGCTCNSPQMGVVDNHYFPGPNSIDEAKDRTWGGVKSMYR